TTVNLDDVGAVVAGASRLRRTAQSLESLATMAEGGPPLERCGRNLDGELNAFQSWYRSLGYALVNDRTGPPPHLPAGDGRRQPPPPARPAAGRGGSPPGCAPPRRAATSRRSRARSCSCGRASISTTSGTSRA